MNEDMVKMHSMAGDTQRKGRKRQMPGNRRRRQTNRGEPKEQAWEPSDESSRGAQETNKEEKKRDSHGCVFDPFGSVSTGL